MDLKEIQELIKLVKKSDISELKIQEGELTVTIKNKGAEPAVNVVANPVNYAPPVQQTVSAAPAVAETKAAPAVEPKADNLITFRSPMVGTFYRKPSADKDTYVKVGDNIENGTVLCIIEAMKLFNEIEFDGGSGKIVKILAEDSSPIEYDQPLFLIEKA
jgi:acetyl-CoA carboxylase biotin carboxyl carrier protein